MTEKRFSWLLPLVAMVVGFCLYGLGDMSRRLDAQSRQTVPAGASLPATCAVGDLFVRNATQIGLYACSSTNGWTQSVNEMLGALTAANFNSTADQSITIRSARYVVRRIVVDNASINLTTAVGGFYTGAGKAGTVIVANTQVYTALTTSAKWVDLTIAATPLTDVLTSTTIFFSLTTPQGVAATGDIRVYGDVLP